MFLNCYKSGDAREVVELGASFPALAPFPNWP